MVSVTASAAGHCAIFDITLVDGFPLLFSGSLQCDIFDCSLSLAWQCVADISHCQSL